MPCEIPDPHSRAPRPRRRSSVTVPLLIAFACALCASAAPARGGTAADEVWLIDGSKIYGRIARLVDGVLRIETLASTSGAIELKASAVRAVRSESSHLFRFSDGREETATTVEIWQSADLLPDDPSFAGRIELADIEAIDPPPPATAQQRFSFVLSGRAADGNSHTKAIGTVGEYELRRDRFRVTLRGDWNYAEDSGHVSSRNASGSLKCDQFFAERSYAYFNTLFEGDTFADVQLRSTAGTGVGYQAFDPKLDVTTASYYQELGLSLFDEDIDGRSDERYATARVSGKLDWGLFERRLELFHFHEIYLGLEDKDDANARAETGLRLKIVGDLFSNLQVNFRWDNTPASGRRRDEVEYLLGLGYKFTF